MDFRSKKAGQVGTMDNNRAVERESPFTYEFSGLTYIDEDRLKLNFPTLIIRVESINLHFGALSIYIAENINFGVTNGKLLLMYEMNEPPHYLIQFAEEKLIPLGILLILLTDMYKISMELRF